MCDVIPCNETTDAPQFARMFLDHVIRLHGLPDSLVTDRGSIFTSRFWKCLSQLLGIKGCLSTAFHPQTDGQMERMNQTIDIWRKNTSARRSSLPGREVLLGFHVLARSASWRALVIRANTTKRAHINLKINRSPNVETPQMLLKYPRPFTPQTTSTNCSPYTSKSKLLSLLQVRFSFFLPRKPAPP
jgi:transposase InsO family protein